MYNIDKIEININNLNNSVNVLIIPDTLKAYKDGQVIDIDQDYIKRLLRIVCLWDKEYLNNNIIDSESYEVTIYADDGIDKYIGKGKYPNNYQEFKRLLGDLNG